GHSLRLHRSKKVERADALERDVGELPHRSLARKVDTPVYSRSFTHGAAEPSRRRTHSFAERIGLTQRSPLLRQHAHRRPDASRPRSCGGDPLRLTEANQPLAALRGRHLLAENRARRPVLRAVLEKARLVQFRPADPLFQISYVFLGFAWETGDERRAHDQARNARPELPEDLQVALAVGGPA